MKRIPCGLINASVVMALLSGCTGGDMALRNEFTDFVPVDRAPTGELVDAPELRKDDEFRVGLPLILMNYGHTFIWSPEGVKVRRSMLRELRDQWGIGTEMVPDDHDEADYRANLTSKAIALGRQWIEARKQWNWP